MDSHRSSSIRFDMLGRPSAASLGQFSPRLEPVFEVILKHPAALTMDLTGALEDFLNLQPIADFRIGHADVLRFESIVQYVL